MPPTEYGTGRIPLLDERDNNFPMRAALIGLPLPTYKYWTSGPVLDQGPTGQCVGFAWRQWLSSSPIRVKEYEGPSAHDIYCRCTAIDPWPENDGCDVNFGTSTRMGAKVLQDAGHIQEYRWAMNPTDARDWILTKSPVVFGTAWRESMFFPDAQGYIHVEGPPGGGGGHCYLAIGFDQFRDAFRILNSWSRDWGQNGRAWIKRSDMAKLWNAGEAEACAATERVVDYNPYD